MQHFRRCTSFWGVPYLNSTTILFDSETGNLFTKKSINYRGITVTSVLTSVLG